MIICSMIEMFFQQTKEIPMSGFSDVLFRIKIGGRVYEALCVCDEEDCNHPDFRVENMFRRGSLLNASMTREDAEYFERHMEELPVWGNEDYEIIFPEYTQMCAPQSSIFSPPDESRPIRRWNRFVFLIRRENPYFNPPARVLWVAEIAPMYQRRLLVRRVS